MTFRLSGCRSRMKHAIAIFLLTTICLQASYAEEPASDGCRLVWADEFDVDGRPDPDNWTFERGFVRVYQP